jgi:hypothetical protein
MSIGTQRVAKHIPVTTNTSIARQRRGKHAFATTQSCNSTIVYVPLHCFTWEYISNNRGIYNPRQNARSRQHFNNNYMKDRLELWSWYYVTYMLRCHTGPTMEILCKEPRWQSTYLKQRRDKKFKYITKICSSLYSVQNYRFVMFFWMWKLRVRAPLKNLKATPEMKTKSNQLWQLGRERFALVIFTHTYESGVNRKLHV